MFLSFVWIEGFVNSFNETSEPSPFLWFNYNNDLITIWLANFGHSLEKINLFLHSSHALRCVAAYFFAKGADANEISFG